MTIVTKTPVTTGNMQKYNDCNKNDSKRQKDVCNDDGNHELEGGGEEGGQADSDSLRTESLQSGCPEERREM